MLHPGCSPSKLTNDEQVEVMRFFGFRGWKYNEVNWSFWSIANHHAKRFLVALGSAYPTQGYGA